MTTAQVVEKSVTTNNSLSGDYLHPDDHGRKKKYICLSNYKLHTCGLRNAEWEYERENVSFCSWFDNRYVGNTLQCDSKASPRRPFAAMGVIVTPKTMCNHNTIFRNEKNRSKLVILQTFSVLCYVIYSGNESIKFCKSLNLIEFIWLEGKPCPPAATCSIQSFKDCSLKLLKIQSICLPEG